MSGASVPYDQLCDEAKLPSSMRYQELVLGARRPHDINLTNNSVLTSFGLVTEAYSELAIGEYNPSLELDGNVVGGFEFKYNGDKVVRGFDDLDFSSKCIKFEGPPILDRIEFQLRTVACSDAQHLSKTVIGYLKLKAGDQVIEVGRTIDGCEEIKGLEHRAPPVQILQGKLVIVGVGVTMFGPSAIQVADFTAAGTNTELESAIATVAYGRSAIAIEELSTDQRSVNSEVEQLVCKDCLPVMPAERIEEMKDLINKMAQSGAFYTFDEGPQIVNSSAFNLCKQKYLGMLEAALRNNDHPSIKATLRMLRALNTPADPDAEAFRVLGSTLRPHHFVSTRSSPVTRLQLLGAPLNHAMSMVNRIVCEKPTLNCYSYCYVKPSSYNLAVATATFVLQIAMLALLGTDSYSTVMDWISGEATPFALWEAIPFAAAVAFYFSLLMERQSSASSCFYSIFRNNKCEHSSKWHRAPYHQKMPYGTLVRLFGTIVNQWLLWALLVFTVVLLASAESRVDLVMNSLAAAFVVELDDMVIDVDDDGVKDCYFEVVRAELLDEWDRVKARYAKANLHSA